MVQKMLFSREERCIQHNTVHLSFHTDCCITPTSSLRLQEPDHAVFSEAPEIPRKEVSFQLLLQICGT